MSKRSTVKAARNRSVETARVRKHSPGNSQAATGFNLKEMQAHAGDAARLLKALANERRLQILCLLAEQERSVGDINALLELSQSALSQHLAVLRQDNLVQTRREAQTVYYSLAAGPAATVIETLHNIYCGNEPSRA